MAITKTPEIVSRQIWFAELHLGKTWAYPIHCIFLTSLTGPVTGLQFSTRSWSFWAAS